MPPKIDASVFEDLGRLIDAEENPVDDTPRPEYRPLMGKNQGVAYDSTEKFVLVYGERYSGKCVSPSTIIYADGGLKRIGDLTASKEEVSSISATVQAFDGSGMKQATAGSFYRNPSREALCVTLSSGVRQIISRVHPLWTETNGCFGFTEGKDLTSEHYVPLVEAEWHEKPFRVVRHYSASASPELYEKLESVSHLSDRKAAEVLGCGAGGVWKNRKRHADVRWDTEITEQIGYFIGAMIGDGCTGNGMSFTNADADVLAQVESATKILGGRIAERPNRGKAKQWGIVGRRIASLFGAIGCRCTAYYKAVPACIIEGPRSVVIAFIRGLFDTDGTASKLGDVSFCTVSRKLADDVASILLALGMHPVVTFKENEHACAHIISLFGREAKAFHETVGFSVKGKRERSALVAATSRGQNHFPPSILEEMRRVKSEFLRNNERTRAWHESNKGILQCKHVPTPEKLDRFIEICGTSAALETYRKWRWVSIASVEQCESDLVDIEVPGPHTFCGNGLIHHNSHVGGGHKLVRHLWRNFNALAIILVGVKSQATQGGIWSKLQTMILPEWREGQGLEFTDVRYDHQKNPYIDVSNKYGGWSRVVLISAPVADFLRKRIRGYEASYFFVDEITTLDSPIYFTAVVQQVGRCKGITDPQQFVAACNPEGPSHWVYQRWWVLPLDDKGDYSPDYKTVHLPSSENPDQSEEFHKYMATVREATKGDAIEEARMIRGEWIDRPSGTAIFKDYYIPQIHRVGEGRKRILPLANFPVIIGYDLGTANNAITFLQQIPTETRLLWVVFDEIIETSRKIGYDVLVLALMRRMAWWQQRIDTKLTWSHISDNSAFNQFRPGSGSYDVMDVERESRKHSERIGVPPIRMVPAPKFHGSVEARVRLLMNLLQREEIVFSAACVKTIDVLTRLESEKQKEGVAHDPSLAFTPKRSQYLHPFDSLTYPILSYDVRRARIVTGAAETQDIIRIGA